jgi:catechol 2,3-dioxygenase-like lactoylglutathione lyase family enzyme
MNFNRLIPELAVANLNASLDFYVHQLGFTIDFDRPAEGFAHLSYQGAQLMLCQDGNTWVTATPEAPRGCGINLQIETDDLAEVERRIARHGIPLFRQTQETWYRIGTYEEGVRELLVQDPDGYLLRFQQLVGTRPAAAPSGDS